MGSLGAPEILIILLVVLLLFGAAKLPTLARSAGRSMRIFKSEMSEMKKDGTPAAEQPSAIETGTVNDVAQPTVNPTTENDKKNQA
ncbi:MAG: Sec-independent protein translocase subunit TatA [Corynebacterium sp.]|uniref:Sec-independent protein translocase subunit TatA n=1 Tax=unclassified Corynebacterium TaxID=2624378 RepID=UPI00264A1C2A|nr:Sec-independent protein translocase subunit TatA [Corynebacterium sp.]